MPEITSSISSYPVMDRRGENLIRNLTEYHELYMLKLTPKPFLELHEERKVEYSRKPLKEPAHCLGKNKASETLWFEDNLENTYRHMIRSFKGQLSTLISDFYNSRTQCLKNCSTISEPSNMRGFCNFNGKIQKVNQRNTKGNEFLKGINEPYVGNTLQAQVMLKTSQLQEVLNKNSELVGPEKRRKTVHRVSSFVIASTVFLWIVMDICSQLSIIQLQPKSGPIFFWSTFLKLFGFMAYVSATAAMIVVRAPFSCMESFMLMFWAILMLVSSAKSTTEVYLLSFGIILTGCYICARTKVATTLTQRSTIDKL